METTYMLNCDNCGSVFESGEAFPERDLCPRCLIVFEAGRKQAKEDMDIQLVSLAELCLNHRRAGIKAVVGWVKPRMAVTQAGLMSTNIDYIEWLGKLKEWGIE